VGLRKITMAHIDGSDLRIEDLSFSAGAAFKLSFPSREDWTFESGGNRALVSTNGSYVLVGLANGTFSDSLVGDAHEVAQQCLDVLAVERMNSLRIENGQENCLLWERSHGKVRLRLVCTLPFRAQFNSPNVIVTDKDGKIVPPPPYNPPGWHPAFRYFRLSQVTDDLYDSYRNLFLALEAVLSDINPPSGGEKQWMLDSLNVASRMHNIDVNRYVNSVGSDPVQDFIDQQYVARRCALFHAKLQKSPLLPEYLHQRKLVADALNYLDKLVMDLIRAQYAARFMTGGMTYKGFETFLFVFKEYVTLAVSSNGGTPSFASLSTSPEESEWIPLTTSYQGPRQGARDAHIFHGELTADEIASRSIKLIGAHVPSVREDPFTELVASRLRSFTFPTDLQLDGVDNVEVHLRCVLDNVRSPRSRFVF
jgi:hypothetical protein